MDEKEKYLKIYGAPPAASPQTDVIAGSLGGGYGRICWGENMLETFKSWNASSLLDVGCGYGNFCDAAALFVPRVYGLDIASVATGHVIDNPEITYLDGEAKALPLPDNAVEWVTAFDCLEHCLEHEIDQILDEFNRVGSKGFVLSISHEPCEMDGMDLHMTVKPESWWIDKLSKYGQISKMGKTPITGAPYLICRKPVNKTLICYCAGSIGTRLRSIAWAHYLAHRTDRRLILLWLDNDPLCRSPFSALFTSPIPLISEQEMLDLPSCKIYAHIKAVADQALISGGKALRKAVRRWGISGVDTFSMDEVEQNIVLYTSTGPLPVVDDDIADCFGHLLPSIPIGQRIRKIAQDLRIDQKIIGVHARGTDFGIGPEAYAHQMQKVVDRNPHQSFLVCSDEPAWEQALQKRFPGRVMIRPKSAWMQKTDPSLPWALGNVDTCQGSVTEALIDLYLLAATQFVIYHESSAFAQVGSLLSRTHSRPRMEKDGQLLRHDGPGCRRDQHHHGNCRRESERKQVDPMAATREPGARANHTIYYYCPGDPHASAGVRRLYRHVSVLHAAGFPAYLLFEKKTDPHLQMPGVPVAYLDRAEQDPSAIFVIPDGIPRIMHHLKDHPGRCFAIALSWFYVFSALPDGLDWRHMNIERVLVVSPVVGRMLQWSMGLPIHQLGTSIDHRLYYYDPKEKQKQIAFIKRKADQVHQLQSLLASRNPDYSRKIKWVGLDGLSQQEYAAQIRRSSIYLSTSLAEGFPTSCVEAMASGAIVCGYDAVGGREILCPDGSDSNSIISSNGDYVSLAQRMAPLLDDLMENRMDRWRPMITRARQTALSHNNDSEAASVIDFWEPLIYGAASDGRRVRTIGSDRWPLQPTAAVHQQSRQSAWIGS
jgi:glycosyltransferase involved in cell wall biosynthesis/SAM-dependent methyltransferase